MKTQKTVVTLAEQNTLFVDALTQSEALVQYNVLSDEEAKSNTKKADVFDASYIHVFRHETDSSLNVMQCFLKHKNRVVKILVNASQFADCEAFAECREIAHKTRYRYTVSYEDFVKCIEALAEYDTKQREAKKHEADKKQSEAKQSEAKQNTEKKQRAKKQSEADTKKKQNTKQSEAKKHSAIKLTERAKKAVNK